MLLSKKIFRKFSSFGSFGKNKLIIIFFGLKWIDSRVELVFMLVWLMYSFGYS